MRHAAFVAFASILVATAEAQVPPKVQAPLAPWIYDPYVRQLGLQQFPGGGAALEDSFTAIEALPDGAVLVAGYTYGSLGEAHAGGSGSTDLFIARFNARGFRQWVSQIGAVTGPTIPALNGNPSGPGGDAGAFDTPYDLAVAADGSIFVTGSTSGSLGETQAGGGDLFLAKFDPAGSLLWLHQLGAETAATIVPEPGATQSGNASSTDEGSSIALHPNGVISIGGSTYSSLSEAHVTLESDFMLARYDASGSFQWVRQMSEVSPPMIGFDPRGYDEPAKIALHPSGRIVLGGSHWFISSQFVVYQGIVMTFDDAGHPLDWMSLGNSTAVNAIAIHPASGRILVGGEALFFSLKFSFRDAFAASLDADLNLEWGTVMSPQTTSHLGLQDLSGSEQVHGMRLDPAGNLILGGSTTGSLNEPNAGYSDVFTAKVRGTDGHILWVSQIGQTTAAAVGIDASGEDFPVGLALGPAGTISLGGATNGDFSDTNAGAHDALLLRLDRNGRLR